MSGRPLPSVQVRDSTLGFQATTYNREQGLRESWRTVGSLSSQQSLQELKDTQVEVPLHPGMLILPGGCTESGQD